MSIQEVCEEFIKKYPYARIQYGYDDCGVHVFNIFPESVARDKKIFKDFSSLLINTGIGFNVFVTTADMDEGKWEPISHFTTKTIDIKGPIYKPQTIKEEQC